MSIESATEFMQRALLMAIEMALPVLAAGLIVGILFSVLQAMTQVHEQTISFIPKLFAMGGVLFFLLPWLLNSVTNYTRGVLEQLSGVVN